MTDLISINMINPRGGGGVLELFFDGVCDPRSETLTHFQGFFLPLKTADLTVFSKFSQILAHF